MKSYAQLQKESADDYYELWSFFLDTYGITLLEGELDDIIHEVKQHEKRMKEKHK